MVKHILVDEQGILKGTFSEQEDARIAQFYHKEPLTLRKR